MTHCYKGPLPSVATPDPMHHFLAELVSVKPRQDPMPAACAQKPRYGEPMPIPPALAADLADRPGILQDLRNTIRLESRTYEVKTPRGVWFLGHQAAEWFRASESLLTAPASHRWVTCSDCGARANGSGTRESVTATIPHWPHCLAGKTPAPIASLSLDRGRIVVTFDEDKLLGLTYEQRLQAQYSLDVLALHLKRTAAVGRVPCPS